MFYFYKDHCTGNGFPDYTAPYFTFPCVIKNEIFMAAPLSENTPPKKLPPLLGSFWMKTPWRVTVWVWHGCPSTYPTFFGGPISETAFRTQKGNGKQKKNPKQPFKPTLGVSPPTSAPKKKSSIANWKNRLGFPPLLPSRWTWNSLGPLRARKWRGSASGFEGAKKMKANWIGPWAIEQHPKNDGLFLGPKVENVGTLEF